MKKNVFLILILTTIMMIIMLAGCYSNGNKEPAAPTAASSTARPSTSDSAKTQEIVKNCYEKTLAAVSFIATEELKKLDQSGITDLKTSQYKVSAEKSGGYAILYTDDMNSAKNKSVHFYKDKTHFSKDGEKTADTVYNFANVYGENGAVTVNDGLTDRLSKVVKKRMTDPDGVVTYVAEGKSFSDFNRLLFGASVSDEQSGVTECQYAVTVSIDAEGHLTELYYRVEYVGTVNKKPVEMYNQYTLSFTQIGESFPVENPY